METDSLPYDDIEEDNCGDDPPFNIIVDPEGHSHDDDQNLISTVNYGFLHREAAGIDSWT